MATAIGARVTAIKSLHDGIMEKYGDGEYLGNLVPDVEPFASKDITNPCIRLDSGKLIWGMQCWWGEKTKVDEKYADVVTETVTVDIENEIAEKQATV